MQFAVSVHCVYNGVGVNGKSNNSPEIGKLDEPRRLGEIPLTAKSVGISLTFLRFSIGFLSESRSLEFVYLAF